MNKLIGTLLGNIYHYYPIGVPSLNNTFDGQKEIKKHIEKKINQIISKEETPWTSLIQNLEHDSLKVFDMGYMQFASYIASIEIEEKNESEFNFTKKIIINISLLCPYYTIFYEDRYVFTHGETLIDHPTFRIFFNNQNGHEGSEFYDLSSLKKRIEMYFPNYSFINHKILFDYNIISGPPFLQHNESSLRPYPLYLFLFDPYLILGNL